MHDKVIVQGYLIIVGLTMLETIPLYSQDAYQQECEATILAITERNGIILDQSIFYPTGGGQPGDAGQLIADGKSVDILTTVKDRESGELIHVAGEGDIPFQVGDKVTAKINWETRYKHMRMHTMLHLLCAVIPCGVTGGQVGADKSRLDFDLGEFEVDKEQITEDLNKLISENHPVTTQWITDEELDNSPDLVRTMSVQPPRGVGKVRLLKIGESVDLQPCGGTHVKNTGEIGKMLVSNIKSKGKRNRRINIVWDND